MSQTTPSSERNSHIYIYIYMYLYLSIYISISIYLYLYISISTYIYIYIYIYQINLHTAAFSLLESSSAQLRSNEDFEGPECSQTTTIAVGIAYRLWLPSSINRMLNLTKLRSIISDQYADSSCFALRELINAAQIK